MIKVFCVAVALCALLLVSPAQAQVPAPVRSDDRVKTMVFDEAEIYTVLAKSGFSTLVEISPKEKIQTLSLGDPVGWQVTPSGNRIFIKPLLKNNTTNLTIITDKRTYQFELIVSQGAVKNATPAYRIKFFYPEGESRFVIPEDRTREGIRGVSDTTIPVIPTAVQLAPPPAPSYAPAPDSLPPLSSIGIQAYNFNYTLTGPESESPKKIFDDGAATYFEYDSQLPAVPQIYAVAADGAEVPVNVRAEGNKYIVSSIAPRFIIRGAGSEQICVFNEGMLASSGAF